MILSPVREMVILSSSFLSGCIIGVTYDILRRIKTHLGFNSLLVDIGDVITFTLLSVCAYYSIYIINDGKVRWYEIFGIFSGFFLYMSMFSHYVIKIIIFAEKAIQMIFCAVMKLIKPFVALFKISKKYVNRLFCRLKLRKSIQKRQKNRIFYKIKCIFRKI